MPDTRHPSAPSFDRAGRNPPRRRARHAWLAMIAASVTTALVGCGAGQVAQTALGDSSVSGLNTGNADGSEPITLHLSSQAPEVLTNGANIVSAPSVALIDGQTSRPPAAEPSAGAAGSPVGEFARIALEPLGRNAYRPGGPETLKAVALSEARRR